MTKNRLVSIKNKLTGPAPIITAIVATAITVATVVYYKKMPITVTKDVLNAVKNEGVDMCYSIDGSDYALKYLGNTPS